MVTELMVNPVTLLQLGFVRWRDVDNHAGEANNLSEQILDNLWTEAKIRRQRIYLALENYDDDVTVYIQENIGCNIGIVYHGWDGLSVERLNDLYRFSTGSNLPNYESVIALHRHKIMSQQANCNHNWHDWLDAECVRHFVCRHCGMRK